MVGMTLTTRSLFSAQVLKKEKASGGWWFGVQVGGGLAFSYCPSLHLRRVETCGLLSVCLVLF